MPYKDPEKRRAAFRKWARENRVRDSKQWYGDRARRAAQKAFPDVQPCVKCGKPGERHHPDITKALEIIWLCKLHHEEAHHGKMKCKLCSRKTDAKGYCNMHYKQIRKVQDPDFSKHIAETRHTYYLKNGK